MLIEVNDGTHKAFGVYMNTPAFGAISTERLITTMTTLIIEMRAAYVEAQSI